MRCRTIVMLVVAIALAGGDASARGTLRFGLMPLELESSSETPLFGGEVDRAVDKYNAAAAAYDRMRGGTTARIDASDLGMTETLFVIAPGFEVGGGRYFFRLEAPIGLSANLKSVGLAMYPLNFQGQLRRGVVAYVSAGGAASWLDRPGTGDIGGLVTVRAAAGVRLSRLVIEVGYSAFALGGSVDGEGIASMTNAGTMQPPRPEEAISAGEARGLVDASLGVTF